MREKKEKNINRWKRTWRSDGGWRKCFTCALSSVDTFISERKCERKTKIPKRGAIAGKEGSWNFLRNAITIIYALQVAPSKSLNNIYAPLWIFSHNFWVFHGTWKFSLSNFSRNVWGKQFLCSNFLLLLARRMHILAKAVSIRHKKKNLLNFRTLNRKLFTIWTYSVEIS